MKKVETKTTVHSQMVRGLTKEISESQGDKLPLVSENGIAVLNRRYLVKDAKASRLKCRRTFTAGWRGTLLKATRSMALPRWR